jgi:hypothetical protein
LVVNVIVLWNTIYMNAALNQPRSEGFDVRDEDVARLSPLGFVNAGVKIHRRAGVNLHHGWWQQGAPYGAPCCLSVIRRVS